MVFKFLFWQILVFSFTLFIPGPVMAVVKITLYTLFSLLSNRLLSGHILAFKMDLTEHIYYLKCSKDNFKNFTRLNRKMPLFVGATCG